MVCPGDFPGTLDLVLMEVVACASLVLAIISVLALVGDPWPRTDMIRIYALTCAVGAATRAIDFGIPDSVWCAPVVPKDCRSFTTCWRTQMGQQVFGVIADSALFTAFALVCYFWLVAVKTLRQLAAPQERQKFNPAPMATGLAGTFIATQIVALFASCIQGVSFFTYMILQRSALLVMCLVAAAVFFWTFGQLYNHANQQAGPAMSGVVSCLQHSCSCRKGGDERAELLSNDAQGEAWRPQRPSWRERQRVERKRARLRKIEGVFVACTVALLLHAVMAGYEVYEFATSFQHRSASAWAVYVTVYYTAEAMLAAALLLILRKTPAALKKKARRVRQVGSDGESSAAESFRGASDFSSPSGPVGEPGDRFTDDWAREEPMAINSPARPTLPGRFPDDLDQAHPGWADAEAPRAAAGSVRMMARSGEADF